MKPRVVYLAYTQSDRLGKELLRVYGKSSYQRAYEWLADVADRHGVRVLPGDDRIAAMVATARQNWWLERHEVV